MTRTERENRLTRTIETTTYEVLAIELSTKTVKTIVMKFVKTDPKTAEKSARMECDQSGLAFVNMTATKTEKNLYVATIDDFIKIAHIESDSEQ